MKPIMVSKETADVQLASERLDHAARYARQGRRFAHVETGVLADAWVEAGWKCARDVANMQLRSVFLDMTSEFELRGFDRFPSDRARAVVDAFATATRKHIEQLRAPVAEIEVEQGEDLGLRFAEFKQTNNRPN